MSTQFITYAGLQPNILCVLNLFHDHNKLKYKSINIYNILHLSRVKMILNIVWAQIQRRRGFKARSTSASSLQYIASSPTLTL